MKWLKKYKDEIIGGVQFFIMMYTMLIGFWWSYMLIWLKVGLPIEAWAIALTLAIALLSLFGLCCWITKENKK